MIVVILEIAQVNNANDRYFTPWVLLGFSDCCILWWIFQSTKAKIKLIAIVQDALILFTIIVISLVIIFSNLYNRVQSDYISKSKRTFFVKVFNFY